MKSLLVIVRRAQRSFQGRLWLRVTLVVAMAIATGATAGLLPSVIGRAVAAIAGPVTPSAPRAPGGFAGLVGALLPEGSPWGVIAVALVATVLTVGLSVWSSKLGSALAGDLTAAVRTEMLAVVLGAAPRDVAAAGAVIASSHAPGPPGQAKPPRRPTGSPPTAAPPPGKRAAAVDLGRGAEVVKLAVAREAAMVSDFAVSVGAGLPQSVATLLVLGYSLWVSDAWFALVGGLGLFVLSRLFADRASRRVGTARRAMQTADALVFAELQETLNASEDLRLWGARAEAIKDFARAAQHCAASRARFAAALAVSGQVKSVFMAMSPLLIVVALELSGRAHGAGEVAELLLLVPLLMVRLEALDALRQGLIERAPLLRACTELLGLPEAPARDRHAVRVEPERIEGAISFGEVSFTPPGADRPLIDRATLEVPAGSVVAICGPSGSGKSTLLRLLLRLDEPDAGTITLDGTDIRRIEPDQLPAIFGVLRQTSRLLERPIEENLGLGLEPKPDRQAMAEALEHVALAELAGRAEGSRSLSTRYQANPPNFSGGELRRLLLARMLLGGARVLVLDEPEAGLPSGTAEDILEKTVALARGRTVLVVTHAPHVLRSDFNVVLDRGRIVAVGSHAKLLTECEVYRELMADALQQQPMPAAQDAEA